MTGGGRGPPEKWRAEVAATVPPTTSDLIRELFRAAQALADRFPGRPFTPDGHPVGSIGEVLAAERYGLTLQPPSTTGHDAIDSQAGGWRSRPPPATVVWPYGTAVPSG